MKNLKSHSKDQVLWGWKIGVSAYILISCTELYLFSDLHLYIEVVTKMSLIWMMSSEK